MLKKLVATLCALLSLGLPASAARIMVVSDIHYMARSLYEDSDLFIRALRAGDGKYTQFSDELMAALCQEVSRERPDALIVTGDLSFNGERASHAALADWFDRIEAQGTAVWVIPGNHDINVATPRGFNAEGWYVTEAVTPEEFSGIYANHMLPPEGQGGLSYTVPVDDALWVAMTDVAYYTGCAQTFGLFTAAHVEWLESVMERARGVELITATHHNLLPHTAFSQESFLMFGHEQMAALARAHGVRLNLSGHIHAQHIARDGELTDAVLGAFCTWPHRYAVVTLEGGTLAYEARSLSPDGLPEGFLEDSRRWAEDIARGKISAALADVDAAEREAMAEYAARFNLAYFQGTYRRDDPAWKDDPAYALWLKHGDNPMWVYMRMVMEESNGENLLWRASR